MTTLDPRESDSVNLSALTPLEMAEILKKAGGSVTLDDIERDIADGAPTDAGGKLNMITYAAWVAGRVNKT